MTEKKDMMFSGVQIRNLIIPLVIEQILTLMVGMADGIMVASVGETAVSGVSLVDTLMVLLINIFTALATGGAVVAGHFIGQKKEEEAEKAAEQLMLFTLVSSLVIMAGLYMGSTFLLTRVFGKIDREVYEAARIYLLIVAASVPFIALYNSGAAIFRAVGNSKISMETSFLMNGINVVGNAIMIYGLKMGVAGAAIPTLISRIAAAAIIYGLLRDQKQEIHLPEKISLRFDGYLIRKILHIGVPNGLEGSMFQLGKILVLSLISAFGTASIAANAVANTLAAFQVLPGLAINNAILTVVAQCVGAGRYDQARYYTKQMMKIVCMAMVVSCLSIILLLPPILGIYHLSPETTQITRQLIIYHGLCAILIWPISFSLPNTLRAANDVKFTMWIAILSMWIFRIVFSYILGGWLGMGVFGCWVAMTVDWLFRAICFAIRYLRGRWQLLTD